MIDLIKKTLGIPTGPTVSEALPLFLESRQRKGLREITITNYECFAGRFARQYGSRRVTTFSRQDLLDICAQQSRESAEAATTFLRWAYRARLSDVDFTRAMLPEVPRSDTRYAVYWTAEEAHAILGEIREPYRPGMIVGLYAGLRPFEACRLDWSDIDFSARRIHVRAEVSKVRRPRKIETEEVRYVRMHGVDVEAGRKPGIPAVIWSLLEPYRGSSGYLVPRNAGQETHVVSSSLLGGERRRAQKKLGIKRAHDIVRHTFATHFVALTQDLSLTAKVLGHCDLTMLAAHYDGSGPRADAEVFFYEPPMIRQWDSVLHVDLAATLGLPEKGGAA